MVHQRISKYRKLLIRISKINNLKQTWRIINQLRGKQKSSSTPYITIHNFIIIANMFNIHFRSLAENLNKNLENRPENNSQNFRKYFPKSGESTLFLEETSINEIVGIINEFQNDKASDIPIVVVKDCALIIAPTLCRIYIHCIAEGRFPNKMKLGKITPVFKKGSKDDIKNYRPVSTLPILETRVGAIKLLFPGCIW